MPEASVNAPELLPASAVRAAAVVVHEGSESAVVAIYDTHLNAEDAIRELNRAGFDMKRLSIIGKDYQTEQDVVGFYNAGDRMKSWGQRGALWGGLWGLLFGSAFLVVPGVGPLFAAGPLVGWIAAAIESAVVIGGLSVVGAALYSVGIPRDSIISYEDQLRAGRYVVVVHGPQRDRDKMREALSQTRHCGLNDHS